MVAYTPQVIARGTVAGDKTGDSLRAWSLKTNDNMDVLFGAFTIDATTYDVTFSGDLFTLSGDVKYTGGPIALEATSSGTADNTFKLGSTNNATYFGINGTAGNRFVGSSANYTLFGTVSATGLELATNNTVRMAINSSGDTTFSGQVNIPNNTPLNSRNAADSADLEMLRMNSSDQLIVGDDATTTFIRTGNTNRVTVTSTAATFEKDVIVGGMLNYGTPVVLTIATGVITVTKSYHRIETEGAAATDDLLTINGGAAGDVLVIEAANDARTVVVKDGTGNLRMAGDFTMDTNQDTISFIHTGTNWHETSRSKNA